LGKDDAARAKVGGVSKLPISRSAIKGKGGVKDNASGRNR
jgi:hypothetical protein